MTMDHVPPPRSLPPPSPPPMLPALKHAYRMRDEYQRAELRLNNQIKALRRRLGHQRSDAQTRNAEGLLTADLERHRDELAISRKRWEKEVVKLAKLLPVGKGIRGLGPLSLGQIIAETEDLAAYANPAKVWKRMGLAVFEGKSQRRSTNKAMAELMGFAPRRRKVMHIVGENLLRQNRGEYKALYGTRKAHEELAHPELSKMHRHKRALRYIEKRLLRELWREWNHLDADPHELGVPLSPGGSGQSDAVTQPFDAGSV